MSRPRGLILTGAGSGSGKTTAAIALAAALIGRHIPVLAAKAGPDFIDAAWLAKATGRPCLNLDLFMASEPFDLAALLSRFGNSGDFTLVEGAMGFYDGAASGGYSTASLAELLDLPALLLINAKGMGQSAAAIASGFLHWHPGDLPAPPKFCGIICSHTGSQQHENILAKAIEPICQEAGISFFGFLPVSFAPKIPSRHLGLRQACETSLDLDQAGKWFENNVDVDAIIKKTSYATTERSHIQNIQTTYRSAQNGPIIAIAKDEAFSFHYADLPMLLEDMGASITWFSPLRHTSLPLCDAIYLPGGYPEIFAGRLSANASLLRQLKETALSGMPIYGECGGYMVMLENIIDQNGKRWPMAGILPGNAIFNEKLAALGYRKARSLWLNCPVACGHEFHYCKAEKESLPAIWEMRDATGKPCGACGQIKGNSAGSWLHIYPLGGKNFWKQWLALAASWRIGHA